MKAYQNQVERFRMIAKKLVDQHSAEFFHRCHLMPGFPDKAAIDQFYSHLDCLGKQLEEQAQQFIGTYTLPQKAEELKAEIWNTCRQYLDQFVQRNQPRL